MTRLLAGSSVTPPCVRRGVAALLARLQFGEVEGLAQVIVGAVIESGNLVGTAVAGGEDQHRQVAAALAQDAEPVAPRQVEDAGMVAQGRAGRFAVAYPVDRVIRQPQAGPHAVTEQGIVLD